MRDSRFVILAGPQCAGKSTASRYLYSRYMVRTQASDEVGQRGRNLVLLGESRQIVMHRRGIHSAIFIDDDTELEIIDHDLRRMDAIIGSGEQRVFLDETNVFTLAHCATRGTEVGAFLSEYVTRLTALDATILFFDTVPAVSWTRRRSRYEERVAGFPTDQAARVLAQYHDYLAIVHTHLSQIASGLELPVVTIDASGTVENTLNLAAEAFENAFGRSELRLVRRF